MQTLYKVVKEEKKERTIRLAQTLTVPKNTCSYGTKPMAGSNVEATFDFV